MLLHKEVKKLYAYSTIGNIQTVKTILKQLKTCNDEKMIELWLLHLLDWTLYADVLVVQNDVQTINDIYDFLI